jgi:hypothetical protein
MSDLIPISFKALFKKQASLLVLIMLWLQLPAQPNTNYALHANIIYRVTKYIAWPENNKSGDFVIGIVGDSPLYDELKELAAGKRVDKQRIIITKLSPSASSYNCQILFVCEDESSRFKKIVSKITNTSTLIISEADGLASEGSCINFVIIEDHLKLEINRRNIENRDLKIASELLQLGIPVK